MSGSLDRALAFYVAAAIFFVIANCFPVVAIRVGEVAVPATLVGAAGALWSQHMGLIALVVMATTVVIPAIELFCTTSVLALAESRHPFGTLAYFFRVRQGLRPWNMIEIFMLGALVAIVKLESLATVVLGTGLWALVAFVLTHAAAAHVFDPQEFWNEIKRPP
jgi:paraquat-inducible protein A